MRMTLYLLAIRRALYLKAVCVIRLFLACLIWFWQPRRVIWSLRLMEVVVGFLMCPDERTLKWNVVFSSWVQSKHQLKVIQLYFVSRI
ncbi:hypothetical protein BD770DRAFT_395269 [Pilaira anomala]|nr:hypothetical protein BD770DRAFT_395269 [Pilaira anomala]